MLERTVSFNAVRQCPFRTNVNRTFCPFPPKLMEHLEKLIRLCLMSDALRHHCSTEIKAVNCCEEQLLHLGICNISIAQCNTPCSFACNSWVQYSAAPLFVELQCHTWWYWTSCTVKKWSVSGRPPTDHLTIDYLPTTYRPHTDHMLTTYRPLTVNLPTTYRPLTDRIPTTCRPHTNHLPSTYRPLFYSAACSIFPPREKLPAM